MNYSTVLFSAFLLLEAFASILGGKPSEILSIKLTESTRGTFRSIEVTPKKRTILINDEEEKLPIKQGEWRKLTALVNKLTIEELDQIKVTSKRHQVDAALHANLIVVTSDGTYTSPTFDHNAPPEELKALKACLFKLVPPEMRDRFQ